MEISIRRGPSASFLLALLCFLLPFLTLSCMGEKRSFSGLQLAVGTTVEQPRLFGEPVEKKVGSQPFATLALACAGLGLFASLGASRGRRSLALGLAALGALSLLLLRGRVNAQVLKESEGMFEVGYAAGYWLAFFAFAAAAAFLVLLLRLPPAEPPAVEAPGRPSTSPLLEGDER